MFLKPPRTPPGRAVRGGRGGGAPHRRATCAPAPAPAAAQAPAREVPSDVGRGDPGLPARVTRPGWPASGRTGRSRSGTGATNLLGRARRPESRAGSSSWTGRTPRRPDRSDHSPRPLGLGGSRLDPHPPPCHPTREPPSKKVTEPLEGSGSSQRVLWH